MSIDRDRRISYDIGNSALGRLLIAATEKGLCGLMWGDGDQELLEKLADRFRRFALRRGLEKPERWFEPVNRFLGGESGRLVLPARGPGNAFSTDRLGANPGDSDRPHPHLRRSGNGFGQSGRSPGGGRRLRRQSGGPGHPLSPGHSQRRRVGRLSLGAASEAKTAEPGSHHGGRGLLEADRTRRTGAGTDRTPPSTSGARLRVGERQPLNCRTIPFMTTGTIPEIGTGG